jgi:hypothetical protein
MPWNNEKTANVTAEIIAERRRQVDTEGWTEEHDDKHNGGELARAGACYALQAATGEAYLNEFAFRFNRRFYPFNAFRSLLGIGANGESPTYDGL